MDSFVELAQSIPMDKITIKQVSDNCGINRNTFYYYYQDLYALKEEIIYVKAQKLFVNMEFSSPESWKSNLRIVGAYARKNEERNRLHKAPIQIVIRDQNMLRRMIREWEESKVRAENQIAFLRSILEKANKAAQFITAYCVSGRTVLRSETDAERSERTQFH